MNEIIKKEKPIKGGLANIQTPNLGIGYNNKLLYEIKEDLKHFKELTTNQVVIMGRKTYESLPEKAQPLPKRINIIVTSRSEIIPVSDSVFIASSPDEALNLALKLFPEKDAWVIGGGEVFTALLPRLDLLCLTKVPGNKPADVFFPDYVHLFDETESKSYTDEKQNINYDIVIARRK